MYRPLRRSPCNQVIAGVCGDIAEYFDVSSNPTRVFSPWVVDDNSHNSPELAHGWLTSLAHASGLVYHFDAAERALRQQQFPVSFVVVNHDTENASNFFKLW